MNKKKNSKIIKKPVDSAKKQDKKVSKPINIKKNSNKEVFKRKIETQEKKILPTKKSVKEIDKNIDSLEKKFEVLEKDYEEKFNEAKIESQKIQILTKNPVIETLNIEIPESIDVEDEIVKEKESIEVSINDSEEKSENKEPAKHIKVEQPKIIVDDSDNKNKVEALLFASGKYLDEEAIANLCEIDKKKVKKTLDELRKDYDSRNCSLMIFQEDHSWKINVREKYLTIVRKIVSDTELNRSTMETLAVIAWKSPVYQSEIVRIRGNKCYDHIEALDTLGFVTKEKKGRSYVLKTTDKFYNYFDIDKGNLKGVLETVKIPEPKISAQQTLENVEEDNKPLSAVDMINVKKKTETEEEKQSHKDFLEQMEKKIMDVSSKNRLLDEEMPSIGTQPKIDVQPIEQAVNILDNMFKNKSIVDNQNIKEHINTDSSNNKLPENSVINQTEQQNNPTDPIQEQKHKSLTKKQLEKKFKEELLRVRDKMEKK